MKILLIQIEKTTDSYLAEGIKIYTERLKNYISFNTETISMPKIIRQKPFEEQRRAEALEIQKLLDPSDFLICMDEHGKQFTSLQFADFLNKLKIVDKEADESLFWLEFINELELKCDKKELSFLLKEANELDSIFCASIRTLKSKHVD